MSTHRGFAAGYPDLDPDNVDYEYLRTVSTSMVPFGDHVGTEITDLGPTGATVQIGADLPVTNHMGTVHAGALFTAADIAGAAAFVGVAADVLPRVKRLVLRGATANYRRPAVGRIRAVATADAAMVADIRTSTTASRFEISIPASLLDDAEVTVAEFEFDYVCDTFDAQDAS